MEEEIKEATVVFEALKSRMYQNKDGHYLILCNFNTDRG